MLHQEGWFSFHVKSVSGKLFEQQVRLINWHFTNHHYLSSVLVLFVWVPVLGAIINTSCSSTGISCPCTIHTCLLSKKKFAYMSVQQVNEYKTGCMNYECKVAVISALLITVSDLVTPQMEEVKQILEQSAAPNVASCTSSETTVAQVSTNLTV